MSPRRGQIHYAFSPRFSSSTLLFLFSPSLSLSSLPCLYIKLTNVRLRFSVVRYRSLRDRRKSLLFSVQMTDNFFLFRDFPLSLSLFLSNREERTKKDLDSPSSYGLLTPGRLANPVISVRWVLRDLRSNYSSLPRPRLLIFSFSFFSLSIYLQIVYLFLIQRF